MNPPSLRTVFRLLVVAELLVPLIGAGYENAVTASLPEDEQTLLLWSGHGGIFSDSLGGEEAGSPSFGTIIGVIGLLAVVLGLLAVQVGLFFFRSWARTWWTIVGILFMPASLFFGWTVALPFTQFCYDLSMIFCGAILAICYASPLAALFRCSLPTPSTTIPS